jgi:hypothetical protein
MKFLKQKTLSKFSPSDQTLFSNQYGRVVMGAVGGLRLPQGTTAQRPNTSGVRYPGGVSGSEFADGMIRYNLDTNSLEALIAGVWEIVRAPGATSITKQTLGPANGTETTFGPLLTVPTGTSYQASDNNILVLIENVFQIGDGTNFDVVQNPAGKAAGWYVQFTSAVPASGVGGAPVYVTVFYGYAD